MLRVCRPIFVSGKALILDSVFCVAIFITELKAKGVFAGFLINKRCCWSKGVPEDLIYTHFENKEAVDVGMIETGTQYNNSFKIFSMKYPDYVMNIIESCMTLYELKASKTRRDFIYSI